LLGALGVALPVHVTVDRNLNDLLAFVSEMLQPSLLVLETLRPDDLRLRILLLLDTEAVDGEQIEARQVLALDEVIEVTRREEKRVSPRSCMAGFAKAHTTRRATRQWCASSIFGEVALTVDIDARSVANGKSWQVDLDSAGWCEVPALVGARFLRTSVRDLLRWRVR